MIEKNKLEKNTIKLIKNPKKNYKKKMKFSIFLLLLLSLLVFSYEKTKQDCARELNSCRNYYCSKKKGNAYPQCLINCNSKFRDCMKTAK